MATQKKNHDKMSKNCLEHNFGTFFANLVVAYVCNSVQCPLLGVTMFWIVIRSGENGYHFSPLFAATSRDCKGWCKKPRWAHGLTKGWFSKRVVLANVPLERKPGTRVHSEVPRNENRNEGTFACSPGTKTGTRAHSPKPPFYETALLSTLSTLDKRGCNVCLCLSTFACVGFASTFACVYQRLYHILLKPKLSITVQSRSFGSFQVKRA